ncbi:unnamed protein product [Arctia plantaginis]|uniref:Uncharacterized protein n=1 Tax=Arctia plantaginis TaxID=874455 RepID=A0A8S1BIL3_ARCPL|nr:unnamed protein product [Arctia plantaginis]
MFLLLFVIGLCVSSIRLEPLDVNVGFEQDINFSPTIMDNNSPSTWHGQPEVNVGSLSIGELSNVEISPTFSKNNLAKLWLQSPKLIAETPNHLGQKNLEQSITFVKNNFPGMLVEKAKLSDSPLYIGAQKKIEV